MALIVRSGEGGVSTPGERTGGRRLGLVLVQLAQQVELQVQGRPGEMAGGDVLRQADQVAMTAQVKLPITLPTFTVERTRVGLQVGSLSLS